MDENTYTALELLEEIGRLTIIEEAYNKLLKHHAAVEREVVELRELAGKLHQQIQAFESEQYQKDHDEIRANQLNPKK